MEDLLSYDTTSTLSSIAEPPDHLERQYSPLNGVFQAHPSQLPQEGSPESNSEAMIRALKALQDKIRRLESERAAAADKFRHLTVETQHHSRMARKATPPVPPPSSHTPLPGYPSSPSDQEDVKSRLESLDVRFTLQARELEQMRKRLQRAEGGTRETATRTHLQGLVEREQRELLDQHREVLAEQKKVLRHQQRTKHSPHSPLPPTTQPAAVSKETEQKLKRLEKEHSATERKIRDMEHRLLEEQWHRKQLQDTATKLQSVAEVNRRRAGPQRRRRKRSRRVCQCQCGASAVGSVCRCRPVPGVHYRVNLRDVPFVVGTSTAPSHSVGANYQQVLAIMKTHSPLLCGAVAASQGKRCGVHQAPPTMTRAEVRRVLAGLEEDLGRLSFEHQELAQQIQQQTDPSNPTATAELEGRLELLTERMETKTEHMRILTKQLEGRKRSKAHPAAASISLPKNGEVEVTTTVRARSSPPTTGQTTDFRTPSLEFLKKMKTLQNTLQQDDLSWD